MALRLKRAQRTVPVAGTAWLRPADLADAPACARILNDWIDATDWIPRVHGPDAVAAYLRESVLRRHAGWVAEDSAGLCGFLALDTDDSLISLLYVASRARGHGTGKVLVDQAKRTCPRGLGLWTFVANTGARRFYEREGFREVARTDGDNEEGLPDILFRWPAEERQ